MHHASHLLICCAQPSGLCPSPSRLNSCQRVVSSRIPFVNQFPEKRIRTAKWLASVGDTHQGLTRKTNSFHLQAPEIQIFPMSTKRHVSLHQFWRVVDMPTCLVFNWRPTPKPNACSSMRPCITKADDDWRACDAFVHGMVASPHRPFIAAMLARTREKYVQVCMVVH